METIAVLSLPTFSMVSSIIEGRSPSLVLFTSIGTLAVILLTIAIWEHLRQPFRHRVLEGRELIDKVDQWLGENDYTRGPVDLSAQYGIQYYERGLEISYTGGVKIWIAVEQRRNILVFIIQRSDSAGEMMKLKPEDVEKLKIDLALEVNRVGATYNQTSESPFTIMAMDTLPVDEHLGASQVLEKTLFMQRVDYLINAVYVKYFVGVDRGAFQMPSADGVLTPKPSPESTPGTTST